MKLPCKFIYLGLIALTLPLNSFARAEATRDFEPLGPGASGGGKVVLCPGKKPELLDLWEAREIHRRKAQAPKGTMKEMLVEALHRLSHSMRNDDIRIELYEWGKHTQTLLGPDAVYWELWQTAGQFLIPDDGERNTVIHRMRNAPLEPTKDALEAALPAGCSPGQAVRFQDYSMQKGEILIDQDIFEAMDAQNQAALIAHEALYKWQRDRGNEITSLRARRAVGLAFAGHNFGNLNAANLPSQFYVCTAKSEEDPERPTASSLSTVLAFPVRFTRSPEDKYFIFQASKLEGMDYLDTAPVLEDPADGAESYNDFSDLSSVKGRIWDAQRSGSVQPELKPVVRIDDAGPGGKLSISIGAYPSIFQPNGMKWHKAECELKTKN